VGKGVAVSLGMAGNWVRVAMRVSVKVAVGVGVGRTGSHLGGTPVSINITHNPSIKSAYSQPAKENVVRLLDDEEGNIEFIFLREDEIVKTGLSELINLVRVKKWLLVNPEIFLSHEFAAASIDVKTLRQRAAFRLQKAIYWSQITLLEHFQLLPAVW
jgi:hypothetical protein